jgi:glycosyltransferase involved in cell wall biosynthesis
LFASARFSTKDFVRDGETGFLVDARDISELSSVMEHVYTHYPEAVEGAKKGSQFVKDHLTWKKVGHLVEKHFLLFDDKRAWQELTDAINKTYIPG